MWFPDGVWYIIKEYHFPIWGRNPWLKKFNIVLKSLPIAKPYSERPRRVIKFYPFTKYIIDLYYLDGYFPNGTHALKFRLIKIYSINS